MYIYSEVVNSSVGIVLTRPTKRSSVNLKTIVLSASVSWYKINMKNNTILLETRIWFRWELSKVAKYVKEWFCFDYPFLNYISGEHLFNCIHYIFFYRSPNPVKQTAGFFLSDYLVLKNLFCIFIVVWY